MKPLPNPRAPLLTAIISALLALTGCAYDDPKAHLPPRPHHGVEGLLEMDDRATWMTIPDPAVAPVDASTLEIRELFNSLDLISD